MASTVVPGAVLQRAEALRRACRTAAQAFSFYAVAAAMATVFFFWLHHLGNGIPYEIAQQRFAEAPPENLPAHKLGVNYQFEYCEMAAAVLAGAASDRGGAVENSVMLKILRGQSPERNYCPEVAEASSTATILPMTLHKPRYWWGGKSIYAIALRWVSVSEYFRFIEIATYCAWLAFAAALALHGPAAFAAGVSLAAFGAAFSGIPYWSDAGNGPGYLCAVAAAALLALSLRWRATSRLARPLCFAAGMASCWLWLFDGHNFLALALIGIVCWLARPRKSVRNSRRAFGCIALYIAGFAVLFALGQAAKAVVFERFGAEYGVTGGFVLQGLSDNTARHLRRSISPQGGDRADMELSSFAANVPVLSERYAENLFVASAFALGAAVAGAVFLAARRRNYAPIETCAWLVGMMLVTGILFALPNDLYFRSARFLFLFPALCLVCLAVVARALLKGGGGSLAVAGVAVVLAGWPTGSIMAKQLVRGDAVQAALKGATSVASDAFDVYLDDGMVIYVQEPCRTTHWRTMFFLHIYPTDADRLVAGAERGKGRKTVDFGFWEADFSSQEDGRCVAARRLPDWDLDAIDTGQFNQKGTLWSVRIQFPEGANSPTMGIVPSAGISEPADDAALSTAEERDAPAGKMTAKQVATAQERSQRRLLQAARVSAIGVGDVFRDCPRCPEMVVVPSGSFTMGSPSSEEGRDDDEGPVHRVRIGSPFAVGVHEVTRGEFGHFVSATGRSMESGCWNYENGEWKKNLWRGWRIPGFSQTDSHPVVCVSWDDAQSYVAWLSRETGDSYRLLSESEWEYVARAGTPTSRYWGDGSSSQCRYANGADLAAKKHDNDWLWTVANCDDGYYWTSPVGSFGANAFGLHDVLGNVWEWTQDCWNDSYAGAPGDGSAWERDECSYRVLRGGSWINTPGFLRAALRNREYTDNRNDFAGFRVARTLTP